MDLEEYFTTKIPEYIRNLISEQKMIRLETKASYEWTEQQYTIKSEYYDDMTENGKLKLELVRAQVKNKEFKRIFSVEMKPFLIITESGMWSKTVNFLYDTYKKNED